MLARRSRNRMHVFVVNLKRSQDRRDHMDAQCAALGIAFEYVQAVDGHDMSPQDTEAVIDGMRFELQPGRARPPLTREEMGCALSHAKIYQTMKARDIDCACVLEDDVELSPDFVDILESEQLRLSKWELLLLGHFSLPHNSLADGAEHTFWRKRIHDKYTLGRPVEFSFLTIGYMIRLSGALKLLQYAQPLRMPSDHLTASAAAVGVDIRILKPTCVKPHFGTLPSMIPNREPVLIEVSRTEEIVARVMAPMMRLMRKIGLMPNSYIPRDPPIYNR